jgi:hypothetical protein
VPAAVLAFVAVACKKKCVGDLATEFARNMNKADETNDGGSGEAMSFGVKHSRFINFEHFRFSINDQS